MLSVKVADEYNAAKISAPVPGKTTGAHGMHKVANQTEPLVLAERRPKIEDEDVSSAAVFSAQHTHVLIGCMLNAGEGGGENDCAGWRSQGGSHDFVLDRQPA